MQTSSYIPLLDDEITSIDDNAEYQFTRTAIRIVILVPSTIYRATLQAQRLHGACFVSHDFEVFAVAERWQNRK